MESLSKKRRKLLDRPMRLPDLDIGNNDLYISEYLIEFLETLRCHTIA